ncbi:MAG TPA: c-type cytochrome domain-containing protein [Chitinophagaceae bacterium]|nr:c-type cytochrome domain-containing protein [Chitinophagaceae bacterium]
MLLSIPEFIGHLHPALIHLPIGILLTALLLLWLSRKPRYTGLKQAVPIILLAGAFSALLSCITGYLLSISDDYDETLVSWHMWMGLATALVSFMLYAKERNPQFGVNKTLLSVGLLVLIFVTGHLGGSLTHGSDYFTKPLKNIFSGDSVSYGAIKPIPNVQEANIYSDVVQPVLQTKCYSCHGPNKQKGGLRMDDSARLMKGGKDGIVIKPGKADESDMIKRMLLSPDDDDHMPPKEKPQPTKEQVALLHWWIENGAAFNKKVKDITQPAEIKPVLLSLQKAPAAAKTGLADIPKQPVEPADAKVMEQLASKGIVVLPVAQNINYLQLNFVTDTVVPVNVLQLVAQLKKQVIWLKINGTNINDSSLQIVSQLTGLTRLDISRTNITDKGLASLQTLQALQYLNLVGTNITAEGLMQLKGLKKLHSLFVYQTGINKSAYAQLRTSFPKTSIDTGGYIVPTLVTDTTIVKAKQAY